MEPQAVHYIPIVTTLLAVPFALEIFRRWRAFPDRLHLLWWGIGVATYGAGTLTEAWTTVFGWHPAVFKAWYITGALLGGAPLAQGTVYLMLQRRTAHLLTAALILYVITASVCVVLSPVDYAMVESHRHPGAGAGVTDRRARRNHKHVAAGQGRSVVRLGGRQSPAVFPFEIEVINRRGNARIPKVCAEGRADSAFTDSRAAQEIIRDLAGIEFIRAQG